MGSAIDLEAYEATVRARHLAYSMLQMKGTDWGMLVEQLCIQVEVNHGDSETLLQLAAMFGGMSKFFTANARRSPADLSQQVLKYQEREGRRF